MVNNKRVVCTWMNKISHAKKKVQPLKGLSRARNNFGLRFLPQHLQPSRRRRTITLLHALFSISNTVKIWIIDYFEISIVVAYFFQKFGIVVACYKSFP